MAVPLAVGAGMIVAGVGTIVVSATHQTIYQKKDQKTMRKCAELLQGHQLRRSDAAATRACDELELSERLFAVAKLSRDNGIGVYLVRIVVCFCAESLVRAHHHSTV